MAGEIAALRDQHFQVHSKDGKYLLAVKTVTPNVYFLFVVQSLSCVRLFLTPWAAACQAPCPLLSPRACSNSCPLSQWCHPTILSSVTSFSSCPQSFPASGSFPVSWLFASGGQNIGASTSTSVFQWIFRVDFIYDWMVWSPCCPRDSQDSSPAPQIESINFCVCAQASLWSNSHIHILLLEKS